MPTPPYSFTIVLGFHYVELIECRLARDENARLIEVRLDEQRLGELKLLASFFPSFAVAREGPMELVIWVESEIYLIRIEEKLFTFYDHSDAVHAAYALDGHWCLVGDASVALVDLWKGIEILRYDHDEILTSSVWEAGRLVVVDLQGRIFYFESLDPSQLVLRPIIDTARR